MNENELIELFVRCAPQRADGIVLGIGDDAAVLRPPPGADLAMTVDAVVAGVHFDHHFRAEDVGWKALAVNLSDLAAMGARPLWALCALATPRGESAARLAGVGRGLARCARAHRIALVGGNVTRARQLSLTITAVGALERGGALRRSGARPGDALLVSGTLGDAALGRSPAAAPSLVRRQRRPEPRLALGRSLAGLAHAAVDISDGLLRDLGHLCSSSRVGARVWLDALPLSPAYRRAHRAASHRLFEAALAGGEDYELLVAVPRERVVRAQTRAEKVGTALTVIGEATKVRGVRVVAAGGVRYRPRARGYDHLAAP